MRRTSTSPIRQGNHQPNNLFMTPDLHEQSFNSVVYQKAPKPHSRSPLKELNHNDMLFSSQSNLPPSTFNKKTDYSGGMSHEKPQNQV